MEKQAGTASNGGGENWHLLTTGIEGLDDILHGGLPSGHVYLVEGDPGAGKTTMALQFLLEGAHRGEATLYITLAESRRELDEVASSHQFDLSKIEIFEVTPPELAAKPGDQYTVFHPAEVELADVMQGILDRAETSKAERIIIDSMSEIRMLAREPLRYRKQILILKQFFVGRNCTVLLLDDRTADRFDLQLQSIVHGALRLENLSREYGVKRRRLEVLKLRASKFREGFHDYLIRKGGLEVFPRLVAGEHKSERASGGDLSAKIKELDSLLGGGIPEGSTTLLIGPAGVGKSSVCSQYLTAAAERGERSLLLSFDEIPSSILKRCDGLGIPLESHLNTGLITLEQIDPAELSPGEFINHIRRQVEHNHCQIVAIDSLNGLLNAMQGEQSVTLKLRELLAYLSQVGVSTFMILAQYGILGSQMATPLDVSYLADNVLLFRYFEAFGSVKQAISVMKRRNGPHERTIRELSLGPGGIHVGEVLSSFQGVLTGVPNYAGDRESLS